MSPKDLVYLFAMIMVTINLLSNLALLLITWCSKHLRSTCNRLIALEALIVVMGMCYTYIFFIPSLLPASITFSRCIWILLVQVVLVEVQSMMPLMIALERLLNVLFPVWAWKRTSRWYTLTMFAPALVYGVAQTAYYVFQVYTEVPDEQVSCTGGEFYSTDIGKYANFKNYAVIGACWAIYGTIWAVMRARKAASSEAHAETTFRRLTHSLLVIIALISVGWAIPPAAGAILSQLPNLSQDQVILGYELCASIGLYGQSALVCPALCLSSNEYRKAFSELFGVCARFVCFRCCCAKNQQQQHQQQLRQGAVVEARRGLHQVLDIVQHQQQQHGGPSSVTGGGFNHSTSGRMAVPVASINRHNRFIQPTTLLPQPPPTLPNVVEDSVPSNGFVRRIAN